MASLNLAAHADVALGAVVGKRRAELAQHSPIEKQAPRVLLAETVAKADLRGAGADLAPYLGLERPGIDAAIAGAWQLQIHFDLAGAGARSWAPANPAASAAAMKRLRRAFSSMGAPGFAKRSHCMWEFFPR